MKITRHLKITGVVQRVGFRRYTQIEAQRLGVTGWVRNRADGSVEAVIHGEHDIVEQLVTWAHGGPRRAVVDTVNITETSGEFETFEILATE